MAVIAKKDVDKLVLELDNGDVARLEEAMQKWNFKDEQSFLRFAVSLFILNEDTSFVIRRNNQREEVVPRKELLKD